MNKFINPKEPGVYRRGYDANGRVVKEYSYWDGEVWHLSAPTVGAAEHNYKVSCGSKSGFQTAPWFYLSEYEKAEHLWFDGTSYMPDTPGIYYRIPSKVANIKTLSYFDGRTWYISAMSVRRAYTQFLEKSESHSQRGWYWRPVNPTKQVTAIAA
ncbi:hypothetical protein ACO0LG_08590 [Undibacterium sp. Ji42W]|uniref:hypothetical protein n=1 Tax=Undibacterium sp. Ji42W TaxID=3413039 RepID=UPI003BF33F0E